jgi:TolA-binding protein
LALAGLYLALAEPAFAEPKGAKEADAGGKKRDADNVTGLSQYMEICLQGNAKYLSRDFSGAIDTFRQAIQLAPKNPVAYYLLGEAQTSANNLTEAAASLRQAESASDDRNAQLRGKILFVVADNLERQGKFDDARAAWLLYNDYADKHLDAGTYPSSGAARIEAIDAMMKQEKAYEAVRQRIAAEKEAGAAPPKK